MDPLGRAFAAKWAFAVDFRVIPLLNLRYINIIIESYEEEFVATFAMLG